MKIERIILIALLVLQLAGCAGDVDRLKPKVSDENAVTIQLFNNKADYKFESLKMSEFIDSVKFVILEETDESLLMYIRKIFFTPEYIIVVDAGAGAVFFFNLDGKYVRKISERGRGPGEYTALSSCMFDEQKQQLIIYDSKAKKMIFYDLLGNFLREISGFCDGALIRDIINLPNGNFLCYTFDLVGQVDEKYTGLWEVDADGIFVRSYFNYEFVLPVTFGFLSHFQQLQNGTISIRDQIHNDIYHYRDGTLDKYISYDIKGSKLPQTVGSDFVEDNRNIRADKHHETDNYIISLWLDETYPARQTFFSLFSKKSKEVIYWDAFHSYDDAFPGVLSWLRDSNRSDILVCELNRERINEHLANRDLPELAKNALTHLLQELGDSENQVLELLYFKK